MNPHYHAVGTRAEHRCEYCHAPEAIFNFPFEVKHIVPPDRDGAQDGSGIASRSFPVSSVTAGPT